MNSALRRRLVIIAAMTLVAVPAAAGLRRLGSTGSPRQFVSMPKAPPPVTGGWIAFATAPAGRHSCCGASGSDILLSRAGSRPRVVASRARNQIWNLCPAFSPDGTMLAFGRWAGHSLTIRVVRVAADGTVGAPQITIAVPDINRVAPCPKWSADGSRLGYLDTRYKVTVRRLDGSRQQLAPGDPRLRDFSRGVGAGVSPAGDLVVRETDNATCAGVISRPDGSGRRVVSRGLCGWIVGWSPDGHDVLVMRDVGAAFTMSAVSIEAPFTSTPIAVDVPVNGERAWPQYGDVSWQPTRRAGGSPTPSASVRPPATSPNPSGRPRLFTTLAADPFPPLKTLAYQNGWREGRWTSGPTVRARRHPLQVGRCIADARALGETEFRSAHWVFGHGRTGTGIASEYVLRYDDAARAARAFGALRTRLARCLRPHRRNWPGVGITDIKELFDSGGPVDDALVVAPFLRLLPTGYNTGVVRDGNVVILIETDHDWPDWGPINLERALLWAIPNESRRCHWSGGVPGSAVCGPAS